MSVAEKLAQRQCLTEEYGKLSGFCFNISCVLTRIVVKLNDMFSPTNAF